DSACRRVRAICSSVKRFLFMANLSSGRNDFARKVAFRLGQDPGSTPTHQGCRNMGKRPLDTVEKFVKSSRKKASCTPK
ncbi:MAG: hypothetical protein VCE91_20740, partial [Nitrospinota bacterium]